MSQVVKKVPWATNVIEGPVGEPKAILVVKRWDSYVRPGDTANFDLQLMNVGTGEGYCYVDIMYTAGPVDQLNAVVNGKKIVMRQGMHNIFKIDLRPFQSKDLIGGILIPQEGIYQFFISYGHYDHLNQAHEDGHLSETITCSKRPVPPAPPPSPPSEPWVWILIAAAIAAMGIGVGIGVALSQKK